MIQFFAPDIKDSLQLPESDSMHCIRVLRMNVGDHILVVDGKGSRFTCRIVDAHPKHTYVTIIEEEYIGNHWGENIVLAIAPTKNIDRIEWLVEKATEIGVNRIIPIKCTHSERKELKLERLQKIIVSAMKQSLKTNLPVLEDMQKITDILAAPFEGQKFIAYCDQKIERKSFMKEYKPGNNVFILIGPEGDFSPEEVDLAISNDFIPVSLGESRLRTETAALFALSSVHTLNQKHI